MPTDNCQKIKLLKLYEILKTETDEAHPITRTELCEKLRAMNISCDPRTITKDVRLLNEQGYEIMLIKKGHDRCYYIADRSFSVPELKILIDAVQAANFVTEGKTEELIDKISRLGGQYRSEILKGNMVCFNTRKHTNESIYYNVGFLEEALLQKKQVTFLYFDLNEHGEKVYRKDKALYTAEPLALVYNEDNYYLVCYSSKYGNICNYRVDRMEQIGVSENDITDEAKKTLEEINMDEYTEQVFKMYGGPVKDITLEFDDTLIGSVYDKFGEDTKMIRTGEHTIVASVRIQESPTFRGWLAQFDGKMRVLV